MFTKLDSSLELGTDLEFSPPVLYEADLALCGQCLFRVTVTMVGWPEKSKGFDFRYFAYPKALTRGLSTALGPIAGGLSVKAIVEDFEGSGTRRGALGSRPSGGVSLFQVPSFFFINPTPLKK